jgi:hypothetical protein
LNKSRGFGILYLFLILAAFIKSGFPQTIPNGDFEEWHTGKFGTTEPVLWEIQNETGFVTVRPGTGFTGKTSACLSIQWDSMTQSFYGGTMTASIEMSSGSHPASITGFIKGSALNTDSLKLSVNIYQKDKLTGSGKLSTVIKKDAWESFNLPLNYQLAGQADLMRVSFSVEPVSGSHYQSVYCIDDLALLGIK